MKRLLFLLMILTAYHGKAQDFHREYVFEHITTKEGLSHNYVTGIVSDSLNVKWVGTENGITKYNGYDFKYLKPGAEYPELQNENIERLFEDSFNNIWIGTKSGGISKLDIRKNEIKSYNHLIDLENQGDIRIKSIAEDSEGNIWIGTWDQGLFVINSKEETLVRQFESNNPIYAILKDSYGNMWFSDNTRIIKYDPSENRTLEFNVGSYVTDLLEDVQRDKIWISTSEKGNSSIYSYNRETQKIEVLDTGVFSDFSKVLSLDSYNRLWIGTWGYGLYMSDLSLSSFHQVDLVGQDLNKKPINYDIILDIHHDLNNISWIATAHGGVVKMVENKGFRSFKSTASKELKDQLNVTAVFRDSSTTWIGTLDGGLYTVKDNGRPEQLTGINLIKINVIKKIKGAIFVGTGNGFYIIDPKTKKTLLWQSRGLKVTAFCLDSSNNLLIGTQQNGLVKVNFGALDDQNAFQYFRENHDNPGQLESNRITSIVEDQKGNLWVGTYNGLHLFDQVEERFIHHADLLQGNLPSVIINTILLEGDIMWLATPSGLLKLTYLDGELELKEAYDKSSGLNNDFICAVSMGHGNDLWFSNNTEIVKLDKSNGSFINYGEIDGVDVTSFNLRSAYNDNTDRIYFGGVDDLVYFNPSQIASSERQPNLIYTSLRINNNLITPNDRIDDRVVIEEDIGYIDHLVLTHKDKLFSIGFAANDYLGKLNTKYRYKLDGFQSEWVDVKTNNEISFTGLDPGEYQLSVIVSRDNQQWSQPKTLDIKILPAPWVSPVAIVIYVLLVVGALSLVFIFLNKQTQLKNNLRIAKIEREKEHDLNEAKISFFTNISHEFRTPLTLILSPLTELLQRDDLSSKASYQLGAIERNAKRLLNLINQLLDFRKADHGLLRLSVAEGNFVRFSSEVFLYFKELAKSKGIRYKFKAKHDVLEFPFDRNKMEIVLCNLLSNAIKYCEQGDSIELSITKDDNYCVVKVKDTGVGMAAENLEKIFDRFYQIQSAQTASVIGSGLGLSFSKKIIELHHGTIAVESRRSHGTTFTVKLSMDSKPFHNTLDTSYVKTDNIAAYETQPSIQHVDNLQVGTHEHTILLIEDNDDIRSYLRSCLEVHYNIIEAKDGVEGYQKATNEMPDLIVSDVMMPGKDGISLCKELKNEITTSHIPIILLTARTSTVFEINGLQTGADDYVTKPFDPNVIMARIKSLLENRRKLREHLLNQVRFEPNLESSQNDVGIDDVFIKKAIQLVEDNIQNPEFGIDTMVDELFMSQSTLYRKIKSLTGLSLTGFIRSIRLKKGAQLILGTDLKMSHVAYEVGFNDYKYFKKSFKEQFNCLPSEYRSQMASKTRSF
jgi:signal transduction histidine kinase/DNA-binding response OmpR family regulator/ligand-binding sensor domain-containing protein